MNKQKNSLFPCLCGHEFSEHFQEGDINYSNVGRHFCQVRHQPEGVVNLQYVDNCLDYRPDNLRYLEQLSNE